MTKIITDTEISKFLNSLSLPVMNEVFQINEFPYTEIYVYSVEYTYTSFTVEKYIQ